MMKQVMFINIIIHDLLVNLESRIKQLKSM